MSITTSWYYLYVIWGAGQTTSAVLSTREEIRELPVGVWLNTVTGRTHTVFQVTDCGHDRAEAGRLVDEWLDSQGG